MKVKLVAKTEPVIEGVDDMESLVAYAARVSNPTNQLNNATADKLLGYCWKNKHYSIFETASLTVEIETSRAISAQIIRHRSFTVQEFSQRYQAVTAFEEVNLRKQDKKNRQNSTDDLHEGTKYIADAWVQDALTLAERAYHELLKLGVAKESARLILPMSTQTRLYLTGNLRSYITYCIVRSEKSTQKEHRDVSDAIWRIVREQCPNIAKFVEDEYEYLKEI